MRKIEYIKVYRNRAEGKVDEPAIEDMYIPMHMAIIGDVLALAVIDGVTELLIQKEDYDAIKKWLAYLGMWNWDGKTFMGMKFKVI